MRFFLWIAISAVGVLAIATAILARYNWNERLAGQLVSVLVVGTATSFVTVLLSLRQVEEERVFSTSVAIDKRDRLPPEISGSTFATRMMSRASDLSDTCRSRPAGDLHAQNGSAPPFNMPVEFDFVSELLQYQIASDIRAMQIGSGTSLAVGNRGDMMIITTRRTRAKEPHDIPRVSGLSWNAAIRANRFAKTYSNKPWEEIDFTVPEGVTLELARSPDALSDTRDTPHIYVVRLSRKGYFEFVVTIHTASANAGGAIPDGLMIDDHVARRCATYLADIRIQFHLERLASGGARAAAFEQWLREMATAIETRWSDVGNSQQP